MSPLYFAVMLRDDPPPPPELPPPHPANTAAAISAKTAPAYAYCLRRAASFIARLKPNIASTAASQATMINGVLRGPGRTLNPGGSEEMVVGKVAVHDAPVFRLPEESSIALAGVQFAVPRLVLPLKNCTIPVGPCVELLCVLTFAVSVRLPPGATLVALGVAAVVVVAWVIVMDSELLEFGLGAV